MSPAGPPDVSRRALHFLILCSAIYEMLHSSHSLRT